ncbi:MAG: hypothetical protein EVA38_05435 [Flavobacteriales bacterium]|nr:MAG: hypothetical protein EVA38_05435 [Flavobacteriales bacterium]
MRNNFIYIFLFLSANSFMAQKSDTLSVSNQKSPTYLDIPVEKNNYYNPLAPAKAAFYSAVLPGLGQVYNKRYWKVPIIYIGIGTSIYFYSQNNDDYNRFRDAYKRRLAGFTDDEFWGSGSTPIVSSDRLEDAQKTAKRNKDLSIAVAVAFYLLNIIDANVDAHLRQFNVNNDLTLEPLFNHNPINASTNYSISLKYRFK